MIRMNSVGRVFDQLRTTLTPDPERMARLIEAQRKASSIHSDDRAQMTRCCPEWYIDGEFLLNTLNGDVWKYNGENKHFEYVEVEDKPLYRAMRDVEREFVKHQVQDLKDLLLYQDKDLGEAVDKLVAAMDEE